MRPMSKFEKKFGKYAIPHLATMLIICYAAGYIIQLINSSFMSYLTLNPYAILHGQVWRLVTWIIVPPSSGSLFYVLIMLYFYWSLGTALEQMWGTYRFNVYIFSGILFTIIGSFMAMGAAYLFYGDAWGLSEPAMAVLVFQGGSLFFSTEYINLAIFLAMAATLPDMQVLVMFIIPVKMKWMGIIYGVIAVWEFFSGAQVVAGGVLILDCSIFKRVAILASLLSFVVFYLTNKAKLRSPKQVKKQVVYKKTVMQAKKENARHKCAVCGRSSESHPDLEFRYCSKCNGNYEYCQDHLFTHTHVQ